MWKFNNKFNKISTANRIYLHSHGKFTVLFSLSPVVSVLSFLPHYRLLKYTYCTMLVSNIISIHTQAHTYLTSSSWLVSKPLILVLNNFIFKSSPKLMFIWGKNMGNMEGIFKYSIPKTTTNENWEVIGYKVHLW